jgi:uncharacterized UPF0146 family protein
VENIFGHSQNEESINMRHSRLNSSHRYKGLVEFITCRYGNAVEIGIGHFPDVALALLKRGVSVFATDVKAFRYGGLKIIIDDIIQPDFTLYAGLDLIYSLRPPSELVPFMIRLAERLSTDLIIKPLLSEHLDGQLVYHGNTPFLLWSYR